MKIKVVYFFPNRKKVSSRPAEGETPSLYSSSFARGMSDTVESGHDGHDRSRSERSVALQKHDSQSAKRLTIFRLTVTVFACIVTYPGNSLITVANS